MSFDFDAAQQDGISEEEIENHLRSQYSSFNFDAAKADGLSLRQISDHLTSEGGEPASEDQEQYQPQADEDSDAPREIDQQEQLQEPRGRERSDLFVQQPSWEEQRLRNLYSGQGIIPNEEEGGEKDGSQALPPDAGAQVGQEAGQGLRSEETSRKQEEVEGEGEGVQPSSTKSKIVAGLGSLGESAMQLAGFHYGGKIGGKALGRIIGGLVAAPVAAAEEVASGGLATPLAVGTELAGAFVGGWMGEKLAGLGERLIGQHENIKKAQAENPILSEVIGTSVMAPLGVKSLSNLYKLGQTKGAKAVAGVVGAGGVVGGALYPVQVGVDKALNYITGQPDESEMSWKGFGMGVGLGAALGGVGLPETGKVLEQTTRIKEGQEKIRTAAKDPNEAVDAAYREAEDFIEAGDHNKAEEALKRAAEVRKANPAEGELEENRGHREGFIQQQIELARKETGETKGEEKTTEAKEPAAGEVPPVKGESAEGKTEGEAKEGVAQPKGEGDKIEPEPTLTPAAQEVLSHEGEITGKTVKAITQAAKDLGVELPEQIAWEDKFDLVKKAALHKQNVKEGGPKLEPTTSTPIEASGKPAVVPDSPAEAPRLQEAAVKLIHPKTGERRIFRGENHDEALTKGLGKGFITKERFKELFGNKNAANRNTDDFGFLDQHGKFHTRTEAHDVAKSVGQLTKDSKFDHYTKEGKPLLHSHEAMLDKHVDRLAGDVDVSKIQGKTAKEALRVAKNQPGIATPLRRLITQVLKLKSTGISRDVIEGTGKMKASAQRSAGKIKFSSRFAEGNKAPISVLLHEAMHSSTADTLLEHMPERGSDTGVKYLSTLKETLKNKSVPAPIKRVIKLYMSAVDQLGLQNEVFGDQLIRSKKDASKYYSYGLTNVHEFVSEAFSNSKFQSVLRNLKGDRQKSLYKSFIDAIRELFNINEGSMLESVMDASFSISEMKPKRAVPEELTLYSMAENPKKYNEDATKEKLDKSVGEEQAAKVRNPFTEGGSLPENGKSTQEFFDDLREADLFRDDIAPEPNIKAQEDMGNGEDPQDKPMPKGYWKFKTISNAFSSAVRQIADTLDGTIVPKLTRWGMREAATALAYARGSTEYAINEIMALYHPELMMDAEKSAQFADLQKKNAILGLHDRTIEELNISKQELAELEEIAKIGVAPRGTGRRIDELRDKVDALEAQREVLVKNHNLEKYEADIQSQMGDYMKHSEGYKKGYMKKMAEMDEALGATDPTYGVKGRHLDLIIPLVGEKDIEKVGDFAGDIGTPPVIKQPNYRNPDVKLIKQGEGYYAKDFSGDLKTQLTAGYAARVHEYQKLMFYKSLEANKAARIVNPGVKVDEVQGSPVARLEAELPVKDPETGKTSIRNQWIYVPRETEKEILQLLQVYNQDVSKNTIFNHITKLQVAGVIDGANHIRFLTSKIQSAIGRDSRLQDAFAQIPILGSVMSLAEVVSTIKKINKGDLETKIRLGRIARTSGMRSKFVKEYDAPNVIKKVFGKLNLHHVLLDWDMASRYILDKRFDNLIKRGLVSEYMDGNRKVGLDEQRIVFLSRIGEYNNRLQARWVATLRDSGISPFFVGGTAAARHAVNMALGRVGFETKNTKAFVEAHAYSVAGLAMAGMIPALINLATTGSMLGRAGTPIGAIDFGEAFDTKDGKRRTFDLFQLLSIRRGLRTLGVNAALQGLMDGTDSKTVQKNVLNDLWTTTMHPFIGPGPSLVYETATGKKLDLRSGWQETYDSRNIGGAGQYVENLRTGLKQQNPLVYAVVGGAIEKGMEVGMGVPAPTEMSKAPTLKDMGIKDDTMWGKFANYFMKVFHEGAIGPTTAMVGGKLAVSPALKLSAQLGTKQQYDPTQDMRYAAREEIMKAVQENDMDKARELYREGFQKQILTKSDARIIKSKIKNPDILLQRVKRLKSVDDKLKVFQVATPEEQDRIASSVWKSLKNSYTQGSSNRNEYLANKQRFMDIAKRGTIVYSRIHPNG